MGLRNVDLFTLGAITVATDADLDRETTNFYTLTLTATDQGDDQMSSSIELTVIIADVNDNFPMFAVDPYTARVPEVGRNEKAYVVHGISSKVKSRILLTDKLL